MQKKLWRQKLLLAKHQDNDYWGQEPLRHAKINRSKYDEKQDIYIYIYIYERESLKVPTQKKYINF